MNQKQIIASLLAVAVLGLTIVYYVTKGNLFGGNTPTQKTPSATTEEQQKLYQAVGDRFTPVADYLNKNITSLSKTESARTTRLQLAETKGIVQYISSDGKTTSTTTADFTYSFDGGKVTITSFTPRKK